MKKVMYLLFSNEYKFYFTLSLLMVIIILIVLTCDIEK